MTVFYHWLWPGNVTLCLAKKEGFWSIDGWLAGGVRPVNINEWSPAKSEVHGMDSKTLTQRLRSMTVEKLNFIDRVLRAC